MSLFKENIKWIFVLLLLIVLSIITVIIYKHNSGKSVTAQIIQNGQVIQTIDLQNIKGPCDFEVVSNNGGYNTIHIENGKIGVVSASCPDKICVKRGLIADGSLPIVCLPNRLSVVIANGNDETDAVSGGR